VIHQLKTELEQKNELDLKLAKLESSIVNSVTTMHNQEKEDMINKLKADLEQQPLLFSHLFFKSSGTSVHSSHVNFLDVLVKINS
jgi:hypothetical protein